jgi:hypothetical protein
VAAGDIELHQLCEPLRPLLGTWKGNGAGRYPTIESFEYVEEITFGHVGKPFLSYTQRTRLKDGPPSHAEAGYLRAVGNDRYEFIVLAPNGIIEIDAVTIDTARGLHVDARSEHVYGTPTAKAVQAVVREIDVADDTMHYRLSMSAVGQPLLHHLEAELFRER